MLLITDCIEYAENLFSVNPQWQKKFTNINSGLEKLTYKLFHSEDIYYAEIDADPLWQYAFVVNHSSSSQFSSLIELSQKEPDLPGGILCLARSGDNFKGYRNRNWLSLPGNIHLSAYLTPNQLVDHFHVGFTILAAISVIQALDRISGLEQKASIKWVNDIFIEDAKVSGVLTHTQTMGSKVTDLFIGIGINVETTPDIKDDFFIKKATSINKVLDKAAQANQASVLKNVLKLISKNYSDLLNGKYNQILDTYRERSNIIGKKVIVYSDPLQGKPHKINQGKVLSIGENLELYLEKQIQPVTRGRIVFE